MRIPGAAFFLAFIALLETTQCAPEPDKCPAYDANDSKFCAAEKETLDIYCPVQEDCKADTVKIVTDTICKEIVLQVGKYCDVMRCYEEQL
jgi:hypothetical protein